MTCNWPLSQTPNPALNQSTNQTTAIHGLLGIALAAVLFAMPSLAQPSTTVEGAVEGSVVADEVADDQASHAADEEPAHADADAKTATETTSAEGSAEGSTAEPDDEFEWLKDEQGRTYRVDTIPKVEGTFARPHEGWARFPGGATFPVIKESDDTFWVKIYQDGQFEAAVRTRQERTTEERAKLNARYEYQLNEVDRLALEPFDNGLPRKGQWRDGFDIADLNGDGHLDIVFGPPRKSQSFPIIFLGDGAGNWRRWREVTFENAAYDYGDVVVGDWNADGHPDLAFGVHLRGILAVVGDGKGNFRLASEGIDFDLPGSKTPLGAFASKSLAAVDWNQDGRMDIVAQGEGPKRAGNPNEVVQGSVGLRVFLSQEDGTWQAVQMSPLGERNFADDFTLIDIDGDGMLDAVTATHQLGNHGIVLRRVSSLVAQREVLPHLPERGLVDSVVGGDFDGDGRDDLLLSYRANVLGKWRSGIDLMLRRDDGWERHAVLSLIQRQPFRALAVGHLDDDEHLDFAALDDFGILRLLLGRGDGKFDSELTLEGPNARLGCQGYDIALRDLDGDGRNEIVAAFAGEAQGMAAFTGSVVSGCEGEGSVRAWKVVDKPLDKSGRLP